MSESAWADSLNARKYDEYTQRFPTYQAGSRRLVEHAHIPPAARVLDLACGTGVTTAEILRRLDTEGMVVAADFSAAMLAFARGRVRDDRVQWIRTPAETIATAVTGTFDAIVCHGAIWQMDIDTVAPQLAGLLAPKGRFVCSTTADTPFAPSLSRPTPGLYDLMRAYAVIDHDFVFQRDKTRRPVTAEAIQQALTAAGLQVTAEETTGTIKHPEALYAWMKIPVFTEHWTGLSYEQRMDALDKAWARFDPPDEPRVTRELIITAHH